MQFSFSEHKLPIGVTTVGLLVATGLAVAPVIMADSASEILTAENSTDIKKIYTLIEQQSTDVEQRINSQVSSIDSQLKNLDIQVITLNKAIVKLSGKSRDQASATEVNSKDRVSDTRITNLEKAVKNLHRKQNKSSTKAPPVIDNSVPDVDMRIQNLEKAVTRMHRRQQQQNNDNTIQNNEPSPSVEKLAEMEDNYSDMMTQVNNLEIAIEQLYGVTSKLSSTLVSSRIAQSQQSPDSLNDNRQNAMPLIQHQQPTVSRSRRSELTANGGINTNGSTDRRIRKLERTIARMGQRLNDLDSPVNDQEVMVDQLYEIQDYIDQVLNQLNR